MTKPSAPPDSLVFLNLISLQLQQKLTDAEGIKPIHHARVQTMHINIFISLQHNLFDYISQLTKALAHAQNSS